MPAVFFIIKDKWEILDLQYEMEITDVNGKIILVGAVPFSPLSREDPRLSCGGRGGKQGSTRILFINGAGLPYFHDSYSLSLQQRNRNIITFMV